MWNCDGIGDGMGWDGERWYGKKILAERRKYRKSNAQNIRFKIEMRLPLFKLIALHF